MSTEAEQVRALQQAILERARELSAEHVTQGEMTRSRIIADAREKVQLMEEKELLSAKIYADREYQRRVQASELRIQAELDRNRWGLVQSVLDQLRRSLSELREDEQTYRRAFCHLLRRAACKINTPNMVAAINSEDLARFRNDWPALVKQWCGENFNIELSNNALPCSGGVRVSTPQNDVMIDNTFEGLVSRREDELQRIIFERLFATVADYGSTLDG